MKAVIVFHKTFLQVVGLVSLSFTGFSQENAGKIVGAVKPSIEKNFTLPPALLLLNANDSSVFRKAQTDSAGNFEFENLPCGKYLIAATAAEYETGYMPVPEITVERNFIYLKTIRLRPSARVLANVTVSAKKPFIQQKAGMMVVNVSASVTSEGLTALELLEKSPGISVDNDGKISLKGKNGVMILIDGKPTYLSGADLTNMLKNMQSSSLDQIEIMTNPSSKYDAAGNSGIINIKTRKGIAKGMNGNASLGYSQGIYGKINNGVNLNYRNDKLNVFGGYNVGHSERFTKLVIGRSFYEEDKQTHAGSADQVSDIHMDNTYYNAKAGLDYYISKKNIAGFIINGNFNDNNRMPIGTINVRDAQDAFLYKLNSRGKDNLRSSGISTNINYQHRFDTTGRELTADVDVAYHRNRNNSLLTTYGYKADNTPDENPVSLRGNIPAAVNIYSFKMDYTYPLRSGPKLEAGIKSSSVHTDNRVGYTRNNGHDWYADDRSNHFMYNENINAGYIILSESIKNWEFTAGLRAENTISKGHQYNNDSSFERNYTNLFPNAGITYKMNAKNDLNLSYSRRVMRPDYNDLNPFIFFLDSLTYTQGNPYLRPQFTHNIELSHTYHKILTTTLNYTRTNDVITSLLKQDTEKKLTYATKDNLSRMRQFGIAVMLNTPVTKWWTASISTNIYNNRYTGLYSNEPIDVQYTSLSANMTNSFRMGKGWNAEISGWYITKAADGLLVSNSLGSLGAGLSKQVLKKQGALKIGIRDILYSEQFSAYARYGDVDVDLNNTKDSRQVNISFNYRFGKKNIAAARKKNGGALDEQNRIKD